MLLLVVRLYCIKRSQQGHLTASQKALIALDMIPMLAEEAKERQLSAGEFGVEGGRGHKKTETLTTEPEEGFKGEAVQQAADLQRKRCEGLLSRP